MSHKISVFGLGYVGCVTAACLAYKGHQVLGVDLNRDKVRMLEAGRSPIIEPQMNELVTAGARSCRLHATTDAREAVLKSDISFLCVGTPSLRNGKLDLGHIEPVCQQIGQAIAEKSSFHLVVMRSTVLPGTSQGLMVPTLEKASGKRLGKHFGVCVNPEFMREGTAVEDFLQPCITVIGHGRGEDAALLRELYAWAPGRFFETSITTAEMVKYVCNAWHALKVSFANEIGTLAKELGVDAAAVVDIFTADTRLNISSAYLRPGFAFGGSCLPKDVRALSYRAKELDLKLPLFESILPSNDEHLNRAAGLVLLSGRKKIAMLGLSFKCGTDDLRESPHVQLIKKLLGEGCQIRIWDENVFLGRLIGSNREYIEQVIPHIGSLLSNDLADVINNAEVVVIGTKSASLQQLTGLLKPEQQVIDLVNLDKAGRLDNRTNYAGLCW